jgi:hypothetical protein
MTEDLIQQLLPLLEKGGTAAAVLIGAHIIIKPASFIAVCWLITRTILVIAKMWARNDFADEVLSEIRGGLRTVDRGGRDE